MRGKIAGIAMLAAALSVGAVAGIAQQDQSSQTPSTQQQYPSGTMRGGMMGGGMGQGYGMWGGQQGAAMLNRMQAHHQQMNELMNKIMQSMTAMQNEKDPKALQEMMTQHMALLEQMQKEMGQQGQMMRNFAGQAGNCPYANTTPDKSGPTQ